MSINATLFAQVMVFFILAWFTMHFVWPPITKALDERAAKVAESLAAADKAQAAIEAADRRVEEQLAIARADITQRLADATRLAQQLVEDGKTRAGEEGSRIVAAAKVEAEQQVVKAREALREDVAALAVRAAEQILRREVDPARHADLLTRIEAEL